MNTGRKVIARSRFPFILCVLMAVHLLSLPGCYKDKEELLYPGSTDSVDCATVPASFAADIQPLITSRCAIPGCHDATASGGAILQTHAQISGKKDRVNQRAIVDKTMPPTGALPPAEIEKIKCWIDAGAPNN